MTAGYQFINHNGDKNYKASGHILNTFWSTFLNVHTSTLCLWVFSAFFKILSAA